MTLGDVIMEVVKKDMAGGKKLDLDYQETYKDGRFRVRLISETDPDAYIHTSVPCEEGEEEKYNYARAYLLSMVFNAAIYGIKRKKKDDKIKPSN